MFTYQGETKTFKQLREKLASIGFDPNDYTLSGTSIGGYGFDEIDDEERTIASYATYCGRRNCEEYIDTDYFTSQVDLIFEASKLFNQGQLSAQEFVSRMKKMSATNPFHSHDRGYSHVFTFSLYKTVELASDEIKKRFYAQLNDYAFSLFLKSNPDCAEFEEFFTKGTGLHPTVESNPNMLGFGRSEKYIASWRGVAVEPDATFEQNIILGLLARNEDKEVGFDIDRKTAALLKSNPNFEVIAQPSNFTQGAKETVEALYSPYDPTNKYSSLAEVVKAATLI